MARELTYGYNAVASMDEFMLSRMLETRFDYYFEENSFSRPSPIRDGQFHFLLRAKRFDPATYGSVRLDRPDKIGICVNNYTKTIGEILPGIVDFEFEADITTYFGFRSSEGGNGITLNFSEVDYGDIEVDILWKSTDDVEDSIIIILIKQAILEMIDAGEFDMLRNIPIPNDALDILRSATDNAVLFDCNADRLAGGAAEEESDCAAYEDDFYPGMGHLYRNGLNLALYEQGFDIEEVSPDGTIEAAFFPLHQGALACVNGNLRSNFKIKIAESVFDWIGSQVIDKEFMRFGITVEEDWSYERLMDRAMEGELLPGERIEFPGAGGFNVRFILLEGAEGETNILFFGPENLSDRHSPLYNLPQGITGTLYNQTKDLAGIWTLSDGFGDGGLYPVGVIEADPGDRIVFEGTHKQITGAGFSASVHSPSISLEDEKISISVEAFGVSLQIDISFMLNPFRGTLTPLLAPLTTYPSDLAPGWAEACLSELASFLVNVYLFCTGSGRGAGGDLLGSFSIEDSLLGVIQHFGNEGIGLDILPFIDYLKISESGIVVQGDVDVGNILHSGFSDEMPYSRTRMVHWDRGYVDEWFFLPESEIRSSPQQLEFIPPEWEATYHCEGPFPQRENNAVIRFSISPTPSGWKVKCDCIRIVDGVEYPNYVYPISICDNLSGNFLSYSSISLAERTDFTTSFRFEDEYSTTDLLNRFFCVRTPWGGYSKVQISFEHFYHMLPAPVIKFISYAPPVIPHIEIRGSWCKNRYDGETYARDWLTHHVIRGAQEYYINLRLFPTRIHVPHEEEFEYTKPTLATYIIPPFDLISDLSRTPSIEESLVLAEPISGVTWTPWEWSSDHWSARLLIEPEDFPEIFFDEEGKFDFQLRVEVQDYFGRAAYAHRRFIGYKLVEEVVPLPMRPRTSDV